MAADLKRVEAGEVDGSFACHDDDDVFIPPSRAGTFALSASSAAVSAAGARRMSSLGSLHHAGHSSWLTASGHLITAIIGAGVLGLPNAVAWLGWAGGILCIVVFFLITLWTCTMLTDCYHVKGKRHTRYKWAVLHIMGEGHSWVLSICQNLNMSLTTIGYQIAAADSMRYIAHLACTTSGHPCFDAQWKHTMIFGGVQVLMSMMPNLESAWWASAVGAIMSLGYSAIAVALGASSAANGLGTLAGRQAPPVAKTFGVFNSLGNIGFAYSSAIVLLEVQDTLREPPAAAASMKKSIRLGLGTTFFFYIAVSVLGYLALGDTVPDNVLLGFTQSPAWVNVIANAMVLTHMISAWQVYAQPVFQSIEDVGLVCFPTLRFTSTPKSDFMIRLGYRSLYVAFTTFVACLLPFFGAFTGLVGAVTFFPTAVAYPILMYQRVAPCSRAKLAMMRAVFWLMAAVALVATAGSIESIVSDASTFALFGKA